MTNFGPIYVNCIGTLFTVAPHGSVLYKLVKNHQWTASRLSKSDLEDHIKSGDLRRR